MLENTFFFFFFWRRLWRIPWTARRSNQSILKEINPQYSLEGLMLKLKFQYSGHLMWRTDSLEKTRRWETLKAGGEGDSREDDGWMASQTQWTWFWAGSGRWWRTGDAWCAAVHGVAKSAIWLSNWTTTVYCTEKILINCHIHSWSFRSAQTLSIFIFIKLKVCCPPTKEKHFHILMVNTDNIIFVLQESFV